MRIDWYKTTWYARYVSVFYVISTYTVLYESILYIIWYVKKQYSMGLTGPVRQCQGARTFQSRSQMIATTQCCLEQTYRLCRVK